MTPVHHFRTKVIVLAAILTTGSVPEAQDLPPGRQRSRPDLLALPLLLTYLIDLGVSFLHCQEGPQYHSPRGLRWPLRVNVDTERACAQVAAATLTFSRFLIVTAL